ncbi:CDK5 regulatory subunit-associated protein 3 isoform X1 [Felis catus]|nr:CDK5 regulatory subunit-associated protein 3 isoform X1 [Felis catus]
MGHWSVTPGLSSTRRSQTRFSGLPPGFGPPRPNILAPQGPSARAHRHPDQQAARLAGRQTTLQSEMAESGVDHPREDQCCHPGHARERGDRPAALWILHSLLPLPKDRGPSQRHRSLHKKHFWPVLFTANEVELSSLLVRNVNYEIPSLKKQIAKCQQLQQEYSRKEEEGQAGATEMREQFYHSCKQYGITGDNVRRELLALVKDLPSQLAEIGAGAQSLGEAIDLYQACVGFVCESPTEQVLPMLRFVQRRGNATVYEWRTGTEPSVVERPHLEEPPEPVEEDAIDWGDFGVEVASEGTDSGISAQAAEIDWGISLESDSKEAGGDGIDWGDDAALQITVLEAGTQAPEGVAKGPDALTLLEYPETRNQFIDELMELEIFLTQRAVEMSEEADILSVSQFQLAPAILQGQTKAKMVTMVSALQDLIGRLTSLRMQHLFMILASPRYVDRVTEFLQQKLKQSQLLALKKELMVQKQQEALQEQAALEPKLDLLLEKTKELQKLIEADISKRYSGRPVNLMGTYL